jgi:hypothetical protein
MDVTGKVLTAVEDASKLMSVQLLRHGICDALVQVSILKGRSFYEAAVLVLLWATDPMMLLRPRMSCKVQLHGCLQVVLLLSSTCWFLHGGNQSTPQLTHNCSFQGSSCQVRSPGLVSTPCLSSYCL